MEVSGYVEGVAEYRRQLDLAAVNSRSLLLQLPYRHKVGAPPVMRSEGGVEYVGGGQYSMLRSWRDRVRLF